MNVEDGTRIDEEARAQGISREELLKRAAVAGLAIAGAGGLARSATAAIDNSLPKRGGTLRLGVPGGSAKDIIDGQYIVTTPDIARLMTGWETLVVNDAQFKLKFDGLASEISANKAADQWTIRVRDGIEFHNGKTMGAADVRYSLQRLINPKVAIGGQASLASVDPKRIKQLDKRTLRLFLKHRDGTILDAFTVYTNAIVPLGYGPKGAGTAKPNVGTGPYKVQSFSPGQQSVHVRNPNYWRTGQPYFDKIVIIDFPDDTARVNALLGGQVEAITNLPASQIAAVKGNPQLRVLSSPTGGWQPFTMRVDKAPFSDPRVRQAMRLIIDRKQMIQQALDGQGRVANDLYAPFDPCYARDLPQRSQDLE